MLVLTRLEGESIRIGEDIVVTILSSDRGKIRVDIEAPRDIPVHRQEVYEQIHNDKSTKGTF